MPDFKRDLHLFADGMEIAQGCRMTLTAGSTLTLRPALHHLSVYDLSDSSAAFLSGAHRIEIHSGASVIAAGELSEALTRVSGGKRITDLVFSPGLSLWHSSVSLSVPGGFRISDTIRALLSASASGLPLAAFATEDRPMARPQAFFGRTCDALALMAETADAEVWVSSAGVCVSGRSPGSPSFVLTDSDLLSTPVLTGCRLLVTTTMMGWLIGSFVRVEWQGNTWEGRIVSALIQADNKDGPWKSELEMELTDHESSSL